MRNRRQIGLTRLAAVAAALAMLTSQPATGLAQQASVQINESHRLLQEERKEHAVQIGERIDDFGFHDLSGRALHVADLTQQGPTVFVFLSTQCPLAKRYTERLKRIAADYAARGVTLIGVYANQDERPEGVGEFVATAGFAFPIVVDGSGYLARRLGATMTPQALVLDTQAKLQYRGAIDDARYENRVKETWLADALDALLAGELPKSSSTASLGCTLHLRDPLDSPTVTYSEHIARIVQDRCQVCHREGQVAPFSLTSYDEAKQWREEMRAYTQKRLMPPWKAAPGFGEFANDFSLSATEIELIARWVEQGAPAGDLNHVPPHPRFRDDWAFGEPDLVIEMPEPYVVGPEGEDDYRHFVIPYEFSEDRFVEAVDVRPGNRNTVHHVLLYGDASGKARELDAADPGPGYSRFGGVGFEPVAMLGGWAPGNRPLRTPPNSGAWLPRNGDLVMQVHYYRTGTEERDLTRVGIYFSKSPRPAVARSGAVINTDFELPPGEKSYRVVGVQELKEDVYLFSVTPHMHLLGRTMEVTAHRPDGQVLPLVRIDDWDFNWQTTYHFRELQRLPAGTRLEMLATFDNSADNPHNPHDPPQPVRWGEKTTDEMCICFLGLIPAADYNP